MTASNDTLEQAREELRETNPRDLPDIARYIECVKENQYWKSWRMEMITKLGMIRSPAKRWYVSTVLDILIVAGTIYSDQNALAWSKAHDMRVTAGMRTKDFLTTHSAPKRYRQMYFNAMLIAWKHAMRLYGVALGQTWRKTRTVVFS